MSLPDSWLAFITVVNASGISPSADVLIAQVLDEDHTQKVGLAQQMVLKVQQHHKPKKDDSGATKGKCWSCGKKGHYIKDCWAKGGGQEGQFKSFLLGSQDLKVNLCGLQQDIRSDGKSKKIVGITGWFPRYSYTVGPYGKGPTGDYTTCTYSS